MVQITDNWGVEFLENQRAFEKANIRLPQFDEKKMREETKKNPQWVHFGGGNLYRCLHAKVAQDLLNKGEMNTGIIVADTFGRTLINNVYNKLDNRSLNVVMKSDGSVEKELIASTAEAYYLSSEVSQSVERMVDVFKQNSLQLVTVTITEKGYTVKDIEGNLTPQAKADIENGANFAELSTSMAIYAYLLYQRYLNGGVPIAMVSTDNFSHNGERFKENLLVIAKGWEENGKVENGFVAWLSDDTKVAFPFSMIDRITPLPSTTIATELAKDGIEGMEFEEGAAFAPFVNTEETSYLVIEDNFPNGRPPLEKAGIYMTDRETVNNADLMKVCSCLNPLHTSLAIFGCLFGYDRIYKEMQDEDLRKLVEKLGYDEGLPVVVNPKIINPKAFIDEVINLRLVNPNIPDSPQRIATDTSQKVGIRYGETIKAYMESDEHDISELRFIPLTIAAWLRYLLELDDNGEYFGVSPDPLLKELFGYLRIVDLGNLFEPKDILYPILSNERIFGVDLYEAGIAEKIHEYFVRMTRDVGSVRKTLQEELKE
ncbi:fructuronate reductase [Pilibacter termitis]|uniref:Fructuronate reductase n=1 Tax=Pilibacter termitis TaxID=263852 RepID=A0A1T4K5A9_9ENTE|nr:mannitol dehydrogenase family protein [Pilibacter termitis]SJZ37517.1 fructuronate reductase [Pilibacter termitis]